MPLTSLRAGQRATITECRASGETRNFLEGLGLMPGARLQVIAVTRGDLIISVKGARLALNRELARQLLVQV